MEFYDSDYLVQHIEGVDSIPDWAIHIHYPDGSEFLYLIWEPVRVMPPFGNNPYYTLPAHYAVLGKDKR